MDIQDVKKAKNQLQVDMAIAIKAQIDIFYKSTGIPVESISIYVDQIHYVGTTEVDFIVNTSISLDI